MTYERFEELWKELNCRELWSHVATPEPAGQVCVVPSVDEIYRWMLDTGSVQLKEMARSVHAELKALRTQTQACGSQNAICETQEGLASMREPQPHAPATPDGYLFQHSETGRTTFVMPEDVDSFSRDNHRWSKVGPMYKQPQTPVVEITEEEIEMTMKMASKRGEQEPRVVKAIHALLSRTGGRSYVLPNTLKIAEVLQEKIMIDEKEAIEVAEEIVRRI